MTDPAVTLSDLTVAFHLADGATYTAVERASLNVADGEFVSIVGPTGCGKSTLLNVTAGLPKNKARERAQSWLARVGLAGFAGRYPHMLSGGQRKRVGLAQVLIRDPKILLMDEPFGPLDAQTRQIMGNQLLDLWSSARKAVLFVTHDLEEAIGLSDRVVIMSAGPAARIIGDWRVALPRPRDIAEVKLDKAFHDLHREIWRTLKDEVLKGYEQTDGG